MEIPAVANGMISVDGCGALTLDDPASPVVVTVATTAPRPGRHRRQVTAVTVAARDPHVSITPGLLARLPIPELARLAAPHPHPGDKHWRALVDGKTGRAWPERHWGLVADVYRWAEHTGRPGGGKVAVAEFWQVAPRPTVYRWLAECRRRRLLPQTVAGSSSGITTSSKAAAARCAS